MLSYEEQCLILNALAFYEMDFPEKEAEIQKVVDKIYKMEV